MFAFRFDKFEHQICNYMKNRFKSLLLMSIAITALACGGSDLKSGIRLENFDKTAKPGDDFYQFVCGGWVKNNPLQPEYSRFGSFDKVAEDTRKQLNDLIEELAGKQNQEGSIAYKIATLYNQMMDSTTLNSNGFKPLEADLKAIRAIDSRSGVFAEAAELMRKGIFSFFYFGLSADAKDSKNNIVIFLQGGLTLGDKEYYIDTDENTLSIMAAYRAHVAKMFSMVGYGESEANKKMEDVLRIETRLAKASRTNVELRDPESNYNKMSYTDFKAKYSNIDFDTFCKKLNLDDLQQLTVGQPEFYAEVDKVFATEDVEALKSYMEWNYINAAASYLSDDFRLEHFNFNGKVLRGRQQDQPRWKRAVGLCSDAMGEALGQLYVEKYFPASHKERMTKLVKNLQEALRERILAQDWMSDSTKAVAIDKLNTFHVKIGYPDTWRDYSGMNVTTDKSLWENVLAVNVSDIEHAVKTKYKQPVDPDEWFMTPQTVNAYYNPTTNEICFPAGILQYPFFDMEADDAFNYGAIGVVIGHEMTHGFDEEGRQYDKEGNLHEWWAKEDAEKFMQRVKPLADFFSNINVLDDLKGNGELTLGENLADHGGLQVSFQAFKNATKDAPLKDKDGFTPEQRFFIAYATVWANNIREEEIRKRTKSDPHSIGLWRVNGTLPHIDSWYEAFNVKEGDKMFIPADNRVRIW